MEATRRRRARKLRVLRWSRFVQGDIDPTWRTSRSSPRSTASRCASTTRAGKTCARRRPSRPTPARARTSSCRPTTTRTSIRKSSSTSPTVCNYLGSKLRRLVSGLRALPAARRQALDRRAARRRRRLHGLSPERGQGRGLRHLPEGHRRLPEAVQGAEGEGHAGGFALGNATGDANTWAQLAGVGVRRQARRQEQQGRHRQPRDDQGARVREGAVSDLRARHAVVARPEQQQGLPRRSAQRDQQRHLDLLRGQDLDRPEAEGDGGRHQPRQHARSARSAIRPSSSCSSTR